MHETLDETLSLLDDLIDEICDGRIEHDDDYFDPELSEEPAARHKTIMERLIKEGDAAVEPLKGYLHDTETCAYILAAEVLRDIGTPAAIWQLIDALESTDSKVCEQASWVLKSIGTPAIQPLIERITDRLDNPAVDENEDSIDVIYTLGALSEIRDPRSFDFMVGLLDRFDNGGDLWNLAHLCSCLYHQHNPEIVPRLRVIAEKYGKTDALNNVVTEANSTIQRLLVDRILESEDWVIYGCCCICEDYDRYDRVCRSSGDYEPYDSFCIQCVPKKEFQCDLCYMKRFVTSSDDSLLDGCDIDHLPPIYVDIEYRLNQDEFTDVFGITASYRDESSISIWSDRMELSFEFHTVGDLNVLKEFFEGAGDRLADGVQFFVDTGEIFGESYPKVVNADGQLVRGDDGDIVAVHEADRFELELVLDPDTIENLIPVIDTQRFILLCDTYTYLDEFRERHDKIESGLRQVMELHKPAEKSKDLEETKYTEVSPPSPPCDHEFELLKTHKKYTVYRCTKCGGAKKEFN